MLILIVLAVSACVCLYYIRTIYRDQHHQSRRQIHGSEIARYLLDENGFATMTIEPYDKGLAFGFVSSDVNRCFLDQRLYQCHHLVSLAQTAKACMAMCQGHTFIPYDVSDRLWSALQVGLIIAWPIFLLDLAGIELKGLIAFASFIYAASLLIALLEFPIDWEMTRLAYQQLKKSQYFDVDELGRLKVLLRTLRYEKMATPFLFPIRVINRIVKKLQKKDQMVFGK